MLIPIFINNEVGIGMMKIDLRLHFSTRVVVLGAKELYRVWRLKMRYEKPLMESVRFVVFLKSN